MMIVPAPSDVLEIEHDMPSLDDAKKVSLDRMREEVNRLEKGLETMVSFDVSGEPQRVQEFMSRHLAEVKAKFQQAKVYYSNAMSDFEGVCRYFGECSASAAAVNAGAKGGVDPMALFSLVQAVVGRIIANWNIAKKKLQIS